VIVVTGVTLAFHTCPILQIDLPEILSGVLYGSRLAKCRGLLGYLAAFGLRLFFLAGLSLAQAFHF